MNFRMHPLDWRAFALGLALTGFVPLAACAGVEKGHVTVPTAGGMPAVPRITGFQVVSNKATVSWQNFCGPYQLLVKQSLADPHWQPMTAPQFSNSVTITLLYSNAFFRVSGPSPRFLGAQACEECHSGIHTTEMDTRHARALQTLKDVGQGNNPACLPCHTVGYGLPSGFVNEAATPHLANVQCENCHGPAAQHAANENDILLRPRVELAGQLCGGCHTGAQHPTYEEWVTTGHAEVVEDMNPAGRINSCGRCHSGSARMALLKGKPLPEGDANIGVVCVTCHDPHREIVHANPLNGRIAFTNALTGRGLIITNSQLGASYTNQVRNPVASTNDFFLATSDTFTNKYDPNVNACAQCHNHRDARYTTSSRPPHHSPQYNMLLGSVGELASGTATGTNRLPAPHALLEKQCVGCHMQTEEYVSEAQPAVSGHKFQVESYGACVPCHGTASDAAGLVDLMRDFVIGPRIQDLKTRLDNWALLKGPGVLQSTNNYGKLAWEYTTPGELSVGSPGPNSVEQGRLPKNIQRARFNLYLVFYDGSYGVHNSPFAITLLDTALAWVQEELNK